MCSALIKKSKTWGPIPLAVLSLEGLKSHLGRFFTLFWPFIFINQLPDLNFISHSFKIFNDQKSQKIKTALQHPPSSETNMKQKVRHIPNAFRGRGKCFKGIKVNIPHLYYHAEGLIRWIMYPKEATTCISLLCTEVVLNFCGLWLFWRVKLGLGSATKYPWATPEAGEGIHSSHCL